MPDNKSIIKDKNKISSAPPAKKTEGSAYFRSVAGKYKKASRVFYIALAAVFALTLLFNAKLLTYTNFNYLIRDLNSAAQVAADNYNSISYTNDEMRVSKNYRGGIITVSSTDMAIYTATGRKTLYMNESFVSPEIAVSKKYAIVYDLGSTKFNVYTSFAKVHTQTLEYPISFVSVADNGWFAVVSKDEAHTSVVYLYDDDFKLKNTFFYGSEYTFLAALDPDGDRIAIVKSKTSLDKFNTSVSISIPGKSNAVFDVSVSEGIPYGGSFLENGDFQLVCTDGYYILDSSSGKLINKYNFSGNLANHVSLNDSGCAVSLTANSGTVRNSVLVFDKKGNIVYNTNIDQGIIDLEYFDAHLFINHGDNISKINIKNKKITTVNISEAGDDIIIYDNGNILLCCKTKAKYIKM